MQLIYLHMIRSHMYVQIRGGLFMMLPDGGYRRGIQREVNGKSNRLTQSCIGFTISLSQQMTSGGRLRSLR